MPFGRATTVRPLTTRGRLVTLGALGAVAALALTGCASNGTASGDATETSGKVARVTVTLTNDGSDRCAVSSSTVGAGPVTFTVKNESSTAITEVEALAGPADPRREGEPGSGTRPRLVHRDADRREVPGVLPRCGARASPA